MKRKLFMVLPFLTVITLILDPISASAGAKEGIDLCIKSVIPSLFPFIFITATISSGFFFSSKRSFLRWIGVPNGCEDIFLMGLLGGYPIGARCTAERYRNGAITKKAASRMLGFCNNAGPSFIFGILVYQFSQRYILWCLWIIQILSAVLTGWILPDKEISVAKPRITKRTPLTQCLNQSLRTMGTICGWIILFRVLCTYIHGILPDGCSPVLLTFLCGILELTNGCLLLSSIPYEPIRFILCSFLLSAGGLCITMQTGSAVQELGFGMYFPGKIIQSAISVLLSVLVSLIIF